MEGRLIWVLAQLTSVLANVNRGHGTPAFSVKDFVPEWLSDIPARSEEDEAVEMNSRFEAWNTLFETNQTQDISHDVMEVNS